MKGIIARFFWGPRHLETVQLNEAVPIIRVPLPPSPQYMWDEGRAYSDVAEVEYRLTWTNGILAEYEADE